MGRTETSGVNKKAPSDREADSSIADDDYVSDGGTKILNEGPVISDYLASEGSSAKSSGELTMGFHTIPDPENTDLPTYAREHSATLTFPEKLMLVLMHVERSAAKSNKREHEFPISWTKDGLAIAIRNGDELCRDWLPVFFGQGKFSSFTRKLYRWGFRQIKFANKPKASEQEIYYANEHFQRDNKSLLSNMCSSTAIKRKRQQMAQAALGPAESTAERDVPAVGDPFQPQIISRMFPHLMSQFADPNIAAGPITVAVSDAITRQALAAQSQLQLMEAAALPHPAQVPPMNPAVAYLNPLDSYLAQLSQLAGPSMSTNSFLAAPPLQPAMSYSAPPTLPAMDFSTRMPEQPVGTLFLTRSQAPQQQQQQQLLLQLQQHQQQQRRTAQLHPVHWSQQPAATGPVAPPDVAPEPSARPKLP